MNHELILKGLRSLDDPVNIPGAGHLGRPLSGGTDMAFGSGSGSGLGDGDGLWCSLGGSGGGGLSWISGSGSGSAFGASFCWRSCSASSSSSSSTSSSESWSSSSPSSSSGSSSSPSSSSGSSLGRSWSGSWGGSLAGGCAGAFDCPFTGSLPLGFCLAAVTEDSGGALIKRPLLSLVGSEMVASLGSRSRQESAQTFSR